MRLLGYLYGNESGSKIASDIGNWEMERGRVRVEKQDVEGNDTQGGQSKHVREKGRCSKGDRGDMGC